MKNNIKYLFLSCLLLSTDIFAYVIGPGTRESYTLHYGITVRQLDLCTDWACTTPFNAFTGSQYIAINPEGPIPGYDEISVNIPNSGTYSYARLKMDNAWVVNGYATQASEGAYCATGSSSTDYSTEAEAKAAATDDTFSFILSKFLKEGTGVDAAGYGWLHYGLRDDQISIPGYFTKYVAGSGTRDKTKEADFSEYVPYTFILTRDSDSNDYLYVTTVLQGNYDFGLGMPSTINFGITVLENRGLEGGVCRASDIEFGGCTTAELGTCVFGPGEPMFDFVIQ